MARILATLAALTFLVVSSGSDSSAQKVRASPNNVDCSTWSTSRAEKIYQVVEAFVHGMITGMSIGADIEFWKAGGKEIDPPEVFLWVDKYCAANPEPSGYAGAVALINERTGNAWNRKFGIQ
jgi:hypothetical protein